MLSGIYALYFKGKLVYIGKVSKGTTKSKRTLRGRLSEHFGKIGNRQNITLAEMQCRYLTFSSEWWVFAAEFALITHYEPEW
ncbi:MAG: Eco29kI family restriction endonuclease, partial [candidate division NC10 bacterium]